MQDSLKVTRLLLLSVGGLIVVVLCVPLVIGYGTAQMNTLGAVPGYFVTCLPGWSLISWYEHDELFIPVDDVRRYLAQGCPGVEPRNIPAPGEYISNSVFLFIQRSLDRWYLSGTAKGRTMPSRQFSRHGIGPLRTIHGFGEHSWQSLGSLPSVFSPGWDMFSQESYGDYPRRRNDRRLGISDTMIEAVEGMASFLLGDILTEMAGGLSSESSAVDIRRDQGDSG